jgi:hypothetical protein
MLSILEVERGRSGSLELINVEKQGERGKKEQRKTTIK